MLLPLARTDHLLVETIGEDVVVYDQISHSAHSLNQSAALVWRHCDGRTSIEEMATTISKAFGFPADAEIVWMALDRLERAKLLCTTPSRPGATPRLTRRQVVQRIGVAGAFALLLPALATMAVPTPAMAQSGVVTPPTCTEIGGRPIANEPCCPGLLPSPLTGICMPCIGEGLPPGAVGVCCPGLQLDIASGLCELI